MLLNCLQRLMVPPELCKQGYSSGIPQELMPKSTECVKGLDITCSSSTYAAMKKCVSLVNQTREDEQKDPLEQEKVTGRC